MRPAFTSPKAAAAFGLLLLFLLAAPWLSAHKLLPQPKETYSSESIRWEKFPWVQKFIFEETNDIDIAFVGSSHMLTGIDTPYVQQKLDEQIGHKTVVRTIGWLASGFDGLYFFTKDLLAHRRVKTLVFYDECAGPVTYEMQSFMPQWYRFGKDDLVLGGLPLAYRGISYYAAVVGMPRNLLEVLSSNRPRESSDEMAAGGLKGNANPELTLGSMGSPIGFAPLFNDSSARFIPFVPQTAATSADLRVFTPATASEFVFSGRPLPVSQIYFARQFALLARSKGCTLVELHLPVFDERTSRVMTESRDWPEVMQTEVGLMGIPGARLFAGLSEPETELLFSNPGHLNLNGQKYFTASITPGLLQYHEAHLTH
jgi:hypothetical protein